MRHCESSEWVEVVRRLWTLPGEFDYHGRFFYDREGVSRAKTLQQPHPPIMNAGSSDIGLRFAAKHADVAGCTESELTAGGIRAHEGAIGGRLGRLSARRHAGTNCRNELATLTELGYDGVVLSWVNYHDEMRQWITVVMSLIEQAGLRRPHRPG